MTITAEQQALQLKRSALLHASVSARRDRVLHTSHNGLTRIFEDGIELASYQGRYSWPATHAALCSELSLWNKTWLDEVVPALRDGLNLPQGHALFEPQMPASEGYFANTSAHVRHATAAPGDSDQLTCGIRLFPAECAAHVFMVYGPQVGFEATRLLKGQEPFLYAKAPAELIEQIVDRFNIGLLRLAANSAQPD
jgi:hypothetical protein